MNKIVRVLFDGRSFGEGRLKLAKQDRTEANELLLQLQY